MHALAECTAASAAAGPVLLSDMRAELAETGTLADNGLLLRFFPVFDLANRRTVALFCAPMHSATDILSGHRAFHDLSAAAWAQIDCAILDHALALAARLSDSGIVAGVGASVGFPTLNDPSGRMLYREALRRAHAMDQVFLVIKIEDIPERTPLPRVGELVASLKTLAPRVWVHLPGSRIPLEGHAPLHARGLVHSMPAKLPPQGLQSEARWLARQAALQSALACMDRVDTPAELEAVRAAGIRFVAGAALDRPALAGDAALADIRDALYGGVPVA